MSASASLHPWSSEALLAKARLYVERMEAHTAADADYAFWSTLTLEFLLRAALAHISPVLLADGTHWRNAAYALGTAPTKKGFSPVSISMREVIARVAELRPTFTEQMAGFSVQHISRRNSELHTGELPFSTLGTSSWLAQFYQTCSVLMESMGKTLGDLVFDATAANALIASLGDEAAKAVARDIKAQTSVWSSKTDAEREEARLQAAAAATRQAGHRVVCPSCGCSGTLQGTPAGVVSTAMQDDEVIERQTMLPSAFSCIACGLRIAGLSRLSAAGLGDAFTGRTTSSVVEFFNLYTEEDLDRVRAEFEPEPDVDFNEY